MTGPITVSLPVAQTTSTAFPLVRIGLIQLWGGASTGSSLTVTLPQHTTVGSGIVVATCGFYGGSVSSITINSIGELFTNVAASVNNAQLWLYENNTQVAPSITVNTSTAGVIVYVYEVSPQLALDAGSADSGTGTTWTSLATNETIPGRHFTIGIGTIVSNSGTITPTSSGWTNEGAFTNIIGAGSHAIGGVTGYKVSTSASTYTYSGTSATSSAWGAATVSFLNIPSPVSYQPGWGGYVFNEHSSYTGITATFTIPSLSSNQYDSVWVGLGNVYQVGIYQTYNTSYSGNSVSRPFTWWLPGAGESWNQVSYPTAAGDVLTISVQLTSQDWYMTITNTTQSWTYTDVKSVLSVNIGSINNDGAGPSVWPYPVGQAEVIIERTGVPLPDYGSVAFTNIQTTPAIASLPEPVYTINTVIDQYPGVFSLTGNSFTMYWNGAS